MHIALPQIRIMNNSANPFHHVEFHTVRPNYLLDLFERVYGFQIIARRDTMNYRQWLLASAQCRLLISSVIETSSLKSEAPPNNEQHYDILTSILAHATAREFILDRDTVFNVALTVKCIQSILARNPRVQVVYILFYITYGDTCGRTEDLLDFNLTSISFRFTNTVYLSATFTYHPCFVYDQPSYLNNLQVLMN